MKLCHEDVQVSSYCFEAFIRCQALRIIMSAVTLSQQWFRICLAMQGLRVQSLVRELDPACHRGATN